MHREVVWDCLLRRGESLGDNYTAVDAACAGRMPWLSGIGEDVLFGCLVLDQCSFGVTADIEQ